MEVPWVKKEARSENKKMQIVWVIVDGGKVFEFSFTVVSGEKWVSGSYCYW